MESFNYYLIKFQKEKDICSFMNKLSQTDIDTRFLLVRSLDSDDLEELLKRHTTISPKSKINDLWDQVFASEISNSEIINYIQERKDVLLIEREAEVSGLDHIIQSFGEVHCGVRNDDVSDLVKQLVRDKDIKTIEELNKRIFDEYLPRISEYIKWSYFNQITGDVIENIFVKHSRILPTMRKIPNIDFFLIDGDNLIPFDLKVTHVADSFFDLLFKGFSQNNDDNPDSYSIKDNSSEIEYIKDFYKANKRRFQLPNFGKLKKQEIIDILSTVPNKDAEEFVSEALLNRRRLVASLSEHLEELEFWNYKYQGERLFANNNRFYVFLAYENSFADGRPLKGRIEKIEKVVNDHLDVMTSKDFHEIRYHYTKLKDLEGDYKAFSTSVLLTDTYD